MGPGRSERRAVVAYLKKFYPAPSGIDGDKYASLLHKSQMTFLGLSKLDPSDIEMPQKRLQDLGQLKGSVDTKSLVWSEASVE
ncbi:hypothetical protein [Streptomyces sp. NBC_01618]|uniref:hypothetical protein n=1 Tax=Streptomyces sp. NBC_01618 TaxID=2975900 RepID=UPI003865E1AA|nr:hypothetical protein OH735_31965 [Streptomyces sp. NBC_01618]